MNLFNSLSEAADVPVEQLKAVLKADKRVSKIFNRKLQLDEIDPSVFLPTINFYVFNNKHVINFADSHGTHFVTKWQLKLLRGTKVLTQKTLTEMTEFVHNLFKEVELEASKILSRENWKRLYEWLYTPPGSGVPQAPAYVIRALAANKSVKPTGQIKVYRGLSFSTIDLTADNRSFSTRKMGLEFLSSIRKGKTTVDLKWDQPSAWTTDLYEATRHAHIGRRAATGDNDRNLTNGLGFVVSALMTPEDIVFSSDRLPPTERELIEKSGTVVVVHEGTYLCKLVKKIDSTGEIPVEQDEDSVNKLDIAADTAAMFGKILKIVGPEDPVLRGFDMSLSDPLIPEQIQFFNSEETTQKLIKTLDSIRNFYVEHVKDLTKDELIQLGGDQSLGPAAQGLLQFQTMMNERMIMKSSSPRKFELTGEQLRRGDFADVHPLNGDAAAILKSQKRFTEAQITFALNNFLRGIGMSSAGDLHRQSWAVQKPVIHMAVSAFYQLVQEEEPDDWNKSINRMMHIIKNVTINLRAAKFIRSVKKLLSF